MKEEESKEQQIEYITINIDPAYIANSTLLENDFVSGLSKDIIEAIDSHCCLQSDVLIPEEAAKKHNFFIGKTLEELLGKSTLSSAFTDGYRHAIYFFSKLTQEQKELTQEQKDQQVKDVISQYTKLGLSENQAIFLQTLFLQNYGSVLNVLLVSFYAKIFKNLGFINYFIFITLIKPQNCIVIYDTNTKKIHFSYNLDKAEKNTYFDNNLKEVINNIADVKDLKNRIKFNIEFDVDVENYTLGITKLEIKVDKNLLNVDIINSLKNQFGIDDNNNIHIKHPKLEEAQEHLKILKDLNSNNETIKSIISDAETLLNRIPTFAYFYKNNAELQIDKKIISAQLDPISKQENKLVDQKALFEATLNKIKQNIDINHKKFSTEEKRALNKLVGSFNKILYTWWQRHKKDVASYVAISLFTGGLGALIFAGIKKWITGRVGFSRFALTLKTDIINDVHKKHNNDQSFPSSKIKNSFQNSIQKQCNSATVQQQRSKTIQQPTNTSMNKNNEF